MQQPVHVEGHFTGSAWVRDVVIGMSDGLTVPFALAAGMTGAVAESALPHPHHIILAAGLAEIAAGSIAMGLGGYLAARGEAEHYASERRREQWEVKEKPGAEIAETEEILEGYGLTDTEVKPIVAALQRRPEQWVDWMMRFELGLEKPEAGRARASALTIAASYIAGGIIPLAPYAFTRLPITTALLVSVAVTAAALAVFGAIKGRVSQTGAGRSAWQTLLIGGLAAAAAFVLARAIPAGK
ncbi:MAG: VIT1/CCC1 transporter family protein [Acidobacteria bacterium]|nr:VIT1/CCC1 transporter family protein [Acidobacteriota bacterium]